MLLVSMGRGRRTGGLCCAIFLLALSGAVIHPSQALLANICMGSHIETYTGRCVDEQDCLSANSTSCASPTDVKHTADRCVITAAEMTLEQRTGSGDSLNVHKWGCRSLCDTTVIYRDCCPHYYGSTCRACHCFGRSTSCSDGLQGNGSCNCKHGYSGPSCEICDYRIHNCVPVSCEIDHGGCHANATCHQQLTSTTCACLPGFAGNGVKGHRSRNERTIEQGEVSGCEPIDPCLHNNGLCDRHIEICMYEGPGKSKCECISGFERSSGRGKCEPVSFCPVISASSLCHSQAVCISQKFGHRCFCKKGYVGRGEECFGDLSEELSRVEELTNETFRQIRDELTEQYPNLLSGIGWPGVTIITPTDYAYLEAKDKSSPWFGSHGDLIRNSLIFGNVSIEQMVLGDVYNMAGNKVKARNSTRGFILEIISSGAGVPYLSSPASNTSSISARAPLVYADRQSAGGVLHIVSDLFNIPSPYSYLNNDSTNVLEILMNISEVSEFYELLRSHSDSRVFENLQEYYTLFIPADGHWNQSYSSDNRKYMEHPMGADRLKLILRGHIVPGRYTMWDLWRDKKITNVNGHDLHITHNDQAQTLVNGTRIMYSDIRGEKVLIHIVDGLLVHPSYTDANIGICTHMETTTAMELCAPCDSPQPPCSRPAERFTGLRSCTLSGGGSGCQAVCEKERVREKCCEHFRDEGYCLLCPGGPFNECSGKGMCSPEAFCHCEVPFGGRDCSSCADKQKYGPNCTQDCTCDSGSDSARCGNSPDTPNGECIGICPKGLSGPNCDISEASCDDGTTIICHVSAVCLLYPTKRCGCPGDLVYNTSTGRCDAPCDPAPCHPRAVCQRNRLPFTIGSPFVRHTSQCECEEGWVGDGYHCTERRSCRGRRGRCGGGAATKCIQGEFCGCIDMDRKYLDGGVCQDLPCTADPSLCSGENMECIDWYLAGPYYECQCKTGYHEYPKGTCFTTLLGELADRQSKMSEILQSDLGLTEFLKEKNVTVLVPSDDAIEVALYRLSSQHQEVDNGKLMHDGKARELLLTAFRFHLIRGSIDLTTSCQKQDVTMDTVFGEKVKLSCVRGRQMLRSVEGAGTDWIEITYNSTRAINGRLVGVSGLLLSPLTLVSLDHARDKSVIGDVDARGDLDVRGLLQRLVQAVSDEDGGGNGSMAATLFLPQMDSQQLQEWMASDFDVKKWTITKSLKLAALAPGTSLTLQTLSGRTLTISCILQEAQEVYLVNNKVRVLDVTSVSDRVTIFWLSETEIPALDAKSQQSSLHETASFECDTSCITVILVLSLFIIFSIILTILVCIFCKRTVIHKSVFHTDEGYSHFSRSTSVSSEEQRTEGERRKSASESERFRRVRGESESSIVSTGRRIRTVSERAQRSGNDIAAAAKWKRSLSESGSGRRSRSESGSESSTTSCGSSSVPASPFLPVPRGYPLEEITECLSSC